MGLLGSNAVSSQLISTAKTPRRGSLSPIACAYEYNTKDASVLKVTDCAAPLARRLPKSARMPTTIPLAPSPRRLAGPNNRPSRQRTVFALLPHHPLLPLPRLFPSEFPHTQRRAPGCLTACPLQRCPFKILTPASGQLRPNACAPGDIKTSRRLIGAGHAKLFN